MFRVRELHSLPCDLQPERPLYFASDLHLGDGSAADDFAEGAHRAAFEWFLRHEVEPEGGRLVLLGDVFELWQCELSHIRKHYGALFWQLHNYRLIRGNHDAAYRKPPEWRWPSGRRPLLLAEHGHQADPLNSSLGFVGRVVTAAAGILERLGWRDVDQSNWRWKLMPTPVTRPDRFRAEHYPNYVRKRAQETGARIVILGHTHKPRLTRLDDGTLYANSGCWVHPAFPGSFVRVGHHAVAVCQLAVGRPGPAAR